LQALEKIAKYKWVQELYPSCTWNIPGEEKAVYLTFDDGPVEGVTPWVLELLRKYQAKATFFCIGENVKRNPELFKEVITDGHAVGNHTNNHMNGWKTMYRDYLKDVRDCGEVFKSNLFRPPYGKIKPLQLRTLAREYHIIMWSYLTGDYNKGLNCPATLDEMKTNVGPGDIIVFHDSLKAEANLRILLPQALEYLSGNGYKFKSIQFKDKN
jgi:peptidoglycan/xylan/chitin deacetylase (PgdA/CDA1 family)